MAKVNEDETEPTGEFKVCEELLEDGVIAVKLVKDEKLLELLAKYFTPEYVNI